MLSPDRSCEAEGMSSLVILVGHGAPPRDAPKELVSKLKSLEAQRRARKLPMGEEERTLDDRLRAWPRTAENDPYRVGVERLGDALRGRLGDREKVVVAYNEFCAPSLEEAMANAARDGVTHVTIVPTMLTPGGVHSEEEIPEVIEAMRAALPTLEIVYAWPFDLDAVAALLASAIGK
jgi:sirohydrochlorin cobaltochelatase